MILYVGGFNFIQILQGTVGMWIKIAGGWAWYLSRSYEERTGAHSHCCAYAWIYTYISNDRTINMTDSAKGYSLFHVFILHSSLYWTILATNRHFQALWTPRL